MRNAVGMKIGVGLAVLLLSACNYRREKMEMPVTAAPTFATVHEFIITPKCLSCHAGAASPMGVDLTSYETIMAANLVVPENPEASPLYQSIAAGRMPKGQAPLPDREKQIVADWIAGGAKKLQAGELPPPPPAAPEPTYTWIAKNVFQARCIGCHDGKHEKTEFDLRTYESLMGFVGLILDPIKAGDPESSGLLISLREGSMPPEGDKISAESVAAIEEWIANGAKNN